MKTTALAALLAIAATGLGACTTIDPQTGERVPNRAATGAIIGAISGAAAGTVAGGDDRRNAAIGATVGAVSGAAIGAYMDKQERELREATRGTGVTVERTAEDQIRVVMPADLTFDTDRADVKPQFNGTLASLANALTASPSTTIDIIGHADSRGSDSYNLTLSERRAASVANMLVSEGVQANRVLTFGRGESQPIASNDTDAGRAANRRVEIKLRAVQQAS
jgi:outer membrane protein OmpA-like peptidoglycan-associated protein